MQKEQIGTTAELLPAEAGVQECPETSVTVTGVDAQDRLLQAVREVHDLELLAGVER
jgi:hypothetical protein